MTMTVASKITKAFLQDFHALVTQTPLQLVLGKDFAGEWGFQSASFKIRRASWIIKIQVIILSLKS